MSCSVELSMKKSFITSGPGLKFDLFNFGLKVFCSFLEENKYPHLRFLTTNNEFI